MYQHHVQLKTRDMLSAGDAVKWYHAVEEYGPESVIMPFMHNGQEIAMEYGIDESNEFPHVYTVPLKRDITTDETAFIISAWEYMFLEDFDIEISNQYDANAFGDFDNSFDIDPQVKQMAIADMKKYNHNRWVESKVSEGWRHGSHYNSREKTHPALRNWDMLPESHRQSAEYSDKEVFEWIQKNKLI